MPKLIRLFLSLAFICIVYNVSVYCQNGTAYCSNDSIINSVAIFAPQGTTVFSASFIEKTLLGFKDKVTEDPLFKNGVFNINDLLIVKNNEISIREIILYYSNQGLDISDSLLNIQKKIASTIKNYDRFLQINIKSFENYIDYQFILYCIGKDNSVDPQTRDSIGSIILPTNKSIASALVDKNIKSDSLKIIITNTLKELFPRAHHPPKSYINVDRRGLNGKNRSIIEWDTIYAAVGDPIYLDGLYSEDKDTPKERLKYRWRRIAPDFNEEELKLIETSKGARYELIPLKADTFQFELFVDDGVGQTSNQFRLKDTIVIISEDKKKIGISPDTFSIYQFDNLVAQNESYIDLEKIKLTNLPVPSIIQLDSNYFKEHFFYAQEDSFELSLSFLNKKTDKQFDISVYSENGIASVASLSISHKKFYPYYFGINWTFNEFSINSNIGLDSNSQIWSEPRITLYGRINNNLTFGVGPIFQRKSWRDSSENEIVLKSLAQLEFSFTHPLLSYGRGNISIDAFMKTYQVERLEGDLFPIVLGLKIQANITLFQGLGSLSLELGYSKPMKRNFFIDYYQWLGLGVKIFIPSS